MYTKLGPPAATTMCETTPKVSPHNTNPCASGVSSMMIEASGKPLMRVEAPGEWLIRDEASGEPLMLVDGSGPSPSPARAWNRGGGGRLQHRK